MSCLKSVRTVLSVHHIGTASRHLDPGRTVDTAEALVVEDSRTVAAETANSERRRHMEAVEIVAALDPDTPAAVADIHQHLLDKELEELLADIPERLAADIQGLLDKELERLADTPERLVAVLQDLLDKELEERLADTLVRLAVAFQARIQDKNLRQPADNPSAVAVAVQALQYQLEIAHCRMAAQAEHPALHAEPYPEQELAAKCQLPPEDAL